MLKSVEDTVEARLSPRVGEEVVSKLEAWMVVHRCQTSGERERVERRDDKGALLSFMLQRPVIRCRWCTVGCLQQELRDKPQRHTETSNHRPLKKFSNQSARVPRYLPRELAVGISPRAGHWCHRRLFTYGYSYLQTLLGFQSVNRRGEGGQ